MEVVGYWTEDVGTSNQLVYMLGYPSLADREKSWAAFAADPAWQKVVADFHRDDVLVRQSHNTILRPTAYQPRDCGLVLPLQQPTAEPCPELAEGTQRPLRTPCCPPC
jgi:hypothetical protein